MTNTNPFEEKRLGDLDAEVRTQELIRSGDIFADDDPILLALQAAARGEIDPKEIGSKKLSMEEADIADRLTREYETGMGPEIVRTEKPETITMNLQPSTIKLFREIAEGYGYWYGGRGRIAALLDAIGTGKLEMTLRDVSNVVDERFTT